MRLATTTNAKTHHEGAESFQVTGPDGGIYEATRADARSAWVVCFPEGQFRFFGTRKEVYSKVNRKARQVLEPTPAPGIVAAGACALPGSAQSDAPPPPRLTARDVS